MPQATGLVAELKTRFGDEHEFELEQGEKGIFDVKVNGQLLFSKHEQNRFPMYTEVQNAILIKGLNEQ